MFCRKWWEVLCRISILKKLWKLYGKHVIQSTWAPVKAYLFLEHLSGLQARFWFWETCWFMSVQTAIICIKYAFIIIPISRDWLFMFRREQSHISSYIEILNLGSCRNRNIFNIHLLQIYNFCLFFAVAKKIKFVLELNMFPQQHMVLLVIKSKATWQEAIFLFIPKVSKLVNWQNLYYKRVILTVQCLIFKMLTHGHLGHSSTHIHVEAFRYGWKK